MGFSIYFETTVPITADKAGAIRDAAALANAGRTWLSCEPVHFFSRKDSGLFGHLLGGVKPNLMPHPADVEAAAKENLPDGTFSDVLEILCRLSEAHDVDWDIRHDFSNGSIGYIRAGVCDEKVTALIQELAKMSNVLRDSGFFRD